MKAFRYFSKSAFWSQFLVGLVAIFALPHLGSDHPQNETTNAQIIAQKNLSNDSIEAEQPYFVRFDSPTIPYQSLQAVTFCEFFVKSYRLDHTTNPPIRAGPQV